MELRAISNIFMASLILEAVWETIKLLIDSRHNKDFLITRVGTLVLGLFLAFSYRIDLLALLGLVDHIPYSGVILSGILISRGSNFVHDLVTRLGTFRQQIAVLTPMATPQLPMDTIPAVAMTPLIRVQDPQN